MNIKNQIYDNDFIDQFSPEQQTVLKNYRLNGEYSVDIEEIARKMGFKVKRKTMNFSGKYDDISKLITIKESEPEKRQRFTIAHEIGHAVQNSSGFRGKDNYTNDERGMEIRANKIAADLLMPKKLMIYLLKSTNKNNTYISPDGFQKLIDEMSKKLNVSAQSVEYRIKNLRLVRFE